MYYIGVIGAARCDAETSELAVRVGEELAKKKAIILCGGRGGVMEGVAMGAARHNGTTVGILPGNDRHEGNSYLTISLATGLGDARNAVITRAADALIAISGGAGTLSEIGLALKMGKTVVGLHTWGLTPPTLNEYRFITADTPEEAVSLAIESSIKASHQRSEE